MALKFTTSYIEDALAVFRQYKQLGERAMAQVTDEQLFAALDDEANSIAIIVKHITGNMRSRWTDFLTSDGEKPTRNRDSEFVDPPATREALMQEWEQGWACVFSAIEPLTDADLSRTVMIRGEAHSVMQAINRQLSHYPMRARAGRHSAWPATDQRSSIAGWQLVRPASGSLTPLANHLELFNCQVADRAAALLLGGHGGVSASCADVEVIR